MEKIHKTEEEWKKILTPEQYKIMRMKETEPAFTCSSDEPKTGGTYHCAACDLPLFRSEAKFESGTGWPSYFDPIDPDNIEERPDNSFGMNYKKYNSSLSMSRTEVLCARCESHLGHVFDDLPAIGLKPSGDWQAGGSPPTGKRYCINSIALKFMGDK